MRLLVFKRIIRAFDMLCKFSNSTGNITPYRIYMKEEDDGIVYIGVNLYTVSDNIVKTKELMYLPVDAVLDSIGKRLGKPYRLISHMSGRYLENLEKMRGKKIKIHNIQENFDAEIEMIQWEPAVSFRSPEICNYCSVLIVRPETTMKYHYWDSFFLLAYFDIL